MSPGRSIRILYGVLLTMLVVTALGGIALLERMSPAIGQILEENVASAEAVEVMLAALARPDSADAREAFFDALSAAEGNVTEDAERESLAVVRRRADAALTGSPEAERAVVEALLTLGAINREAMHEADREARRLGSAGRWALSFLALMGVLAGVVAARRVRRDLVEPLIELDTVIDARRSGDLHRRLRPMGTTTLRPMLLALNELLDQLERTPSRRRVSEQAARAMVAALLDRSDEPLAVMDDDGEVIAASRDALDRLASDDEPEIEEVLAIDDAPLRLVRLVSPA